MTLAEEIKSGEEFVRTLPGVAEFSLIGSSMYLPDAQDIDYLLLVNDGRVGCDYAADLTNTGFQPCGEYDTAQGHWCAVRRDRLNIVITSDPEFYQRFKRAMEVCKALRLTNKDERVAVCRIVRDGWDADAALPAGYREAA